MQINSAFKDIVLDNHTKYLIVYGGAGSSKSYSITQKLILKCLQSKRIVLVFRKAGVTLNDSVIRLFLDILNKENIPYQYLSSTRTLHIGESVVIFKCIDSEERIKSVICTDIWLEEANEFFPSDFSQLQLRLRSDVPDTQMILSFNPVSKLCWLYSFFFDPDSPQYFLEGRSYKIHKSTYRDNRFLSQDYIDDLLSLKKSNPLYFNIYAEAEWGTQGSLVFPYGTYSIKKLEVPLGTRHVYGCDPGATDKFAIVGAALLPENTLYFYKEFCKSNVLCKEVAEWTRSNIPSNATIWTDPAGKAQIMELNAMGLYSFRGCSKPPGSVLSTIDILKSFNIVISPECENLIKDFSMYQYEKDKKTGLYLNEPARVVDGYHCDAIDAARYATNGLGREATLLKIKLPKGL